MTPLRLKTKALSSFETSRNSNAATVSDVEEDLNSERCCKPRHPSVYITETMCAGRMVGEAVVADLRVPSYYEYGRNSKKETPRLCAF
jgi:hypothetical protein